MPSVAPLMPETVTLANARLILPEREILGHVTIENGMIAEVASGGHVPRGAIDCEGDIVAPGLVELHTDNLERHIRPRPTAIWPLKPAIVAHDGELAACGITTVFDAIRVGSIGGASGTGWARSTRALADDVLAMRAQGALKISHHLHLRAEVCSETLIDELNQFGPNDRIGIVSIMDHTPGQRQFADLKQYEAHVKGKHAYDDAGFQQHKAIRMALGNKMRDLHEKAAVEAAQRFGAVLASHDDTLAEHVFQSARYGVSLAEFPTTKDAARACRQTGLTIMMGAPNLVRGASHSGNVAASELAQDDLLDAVSSDYVPAALLYSAMLLADIWRDLPRALSTVTVAPARAAGFLDRGKLAEGSRGDVIRFRMVDKVPVLRGVWSGGRRVA